MDDWIPFGRLTRPHGVRGESRLVPYSVSDPLPETVEHVRVSTAQDVRPLTISGVRSTHDAYLVSFVELADRDEVAKLAGAELSVRRQDLPALAPGEFYLYELVGAAVCDEPGERLGVVRGISRTRGQELLVVDTPRGERLINTMGDTLVRFDRLAKSITVRFAADGWD